MTKTSFTCLVRANWWILFASVLKQGIAAPTHWSHDNVPDYRFITTEKYLVFVKKKGEEKQTLNKNSKVSYPRQYVKYHLAHQ